MNSLSKAEWGMWMKKAVDWSCLVWLVLMVAKAAAAAAATCRPVEEEEEIGCFKV
jgi:hypothetical protein